MKKSCRVLDYAVEKKNINIIKNLLNCGIDEIDINTFFNIKYYNNEEKKI